MECLESDQNRIPLLRTDHRQLISILKLHSAAWVGEGSPGALHRQQLDLVGGAHQLPMEPRLQLTLFGGIADGASAKRVASTTTRRSAMTDSSGQNALSNCLGRTCLKWGEDGELTALDLSLVMERLAQVDQEVAALKQVSSAIQACPSAS